MTRQQKRILVILGILDLVVITLLASVVVRSMRPAPETSPVVVQASPCEQRLIEILAVSPFFADGIPKVAWDNQQLDLSFRFAYATATPPEDSAQLLWHALDILAEVTTGECALPATVTIAIEAQGQVETRQFLAQFTGDQIEGWATGHVSEEALAAQARYRQITTSP